MFNRFCICLITAAFLSTLSACNEPCPVCPECDSCCPVCPVCPECLECPDDYTLIKEELVWRCELLPDRVPEDYITLARGARIINDVDVESRSDIYLSIHSGVRDEEYAANHCGSIVKGVLGLTANELRVMAAEGQTLINQWEHKWRKNLSTVNWRAETDARFCPTDKPKLCRSNVYEKNWDPYLARLRSHRLQANCNRRQAQLDPLADCDFDTVEGWCRCRNGNLQ